MTLRLKPRACVCAPPQLCIPLPVRSFGFIARHIRAYRQDARAHPVLPDEQRSQGDIPCTNQIRMERKMAVLTHEQEALIGTVLRRNIATFGASLTGMVGIDFDSHIRTSSGLVNDVAMQFSKSPLGGMTVCPPLLLRSFLAMLALRPFADVCQLFQTNDALWVLGDDAMTDGVVHSLFQPSLSSTYDDKSPSSRASAFLLQPFGQSRIVVGFGAYRLARIERGVVARIRRDSKVALSDINPYNIFVGFRRRVCYFEFQTDEQVELLLWLIIPEFSGSKMSILLEQSHMVAIARVGHDHTALQGQDAYLGIFLQAIVPMIVIGERRRDILGGFIQALITFLRMTRSAMSGILPDFGPQRLIGGTDLAGDVTGHLGRYLMPETNLIIAAPLQSTATTHLAMLKRILTHIVQGITISQLRLAQSGELLWRRMQFQFGGDDLFHGSSLADIHALVKFGMVREDFSACGQSFFPPHA